MYRVVLAALVAGGVASSAMAQNATAPVEPNAPVAEAPVDASVTPLHSGETLKAFLVRISQDDFNGTAQQFAAALKANPALLEEFILLKSDPELGPSVLAEATKGLIGMAEANALAIAEQVSAMALKDMGSVAQLIALARESGSTIISEVFGEGLALAANKATQSGDTIKAAAIQSQATSRDAPIVLSEAFLDNALQTAAGNEFASFLGAGGGGDIANNVSSLLSDSSGNETSNDGTSSQSTYSRTSSSSRSTTLSSGTITIFINTSPTE